jgi:hypothetical protein
MSGGRQRGMVSDNTGTGDQVVNQLLSKMDGAASLGLSGVLSVCQVWSSSTTCW